MSPAGGGRGPHLLPPHWPRRQGGQGEGEGEGEGEEDGDDPRLLASSLTLECSEAYEILCLLKLRHLQIIFYCILNDQETYKKVN